MKHEGKSILEELFNSSPKEIEGNQLSFEIKTEITNYLKTPIEEGIKKILEFSAKPSLIMLFLEELGFVGTPLHYFDGIAIKFVAPSDYPFSIFLKIDFLEFICVISNNSFNSFGYGY